jgi:hypothetical protein
MACSGAHCTNHDLGTTTCVGHRPSCATNRYLASSGDFGVEGQRLRASDIEDLRSKIRNELSRYNQHALYNFTLLVPSTISVTADVDNTHVEGMREMVVDVAGGPLYPDKTGDPIDNDDWAAGIADIYNIIRQDCICNADCSCNAICACHNDCGCNYSDERLKTDIQYL